MKKPRIGIAIVTYNASAFITDCLDSLTKLTYKQTQVVIVDNASTDKTCRIITHKSPHIVLIQNKKNAGYAKACNQAAEYLLRPCEYILLLNPDTRVLPQLIENLLLPFKDDTTGVSGAIITYDSDPKKIWFAGGFLHPVFGYTRHIGMNTQPVKTNGVIETTDFITGCCMLIKREVIEKLGLFDETYGFYFEDVDFCYRVRKLGYYCRIIKQPLLSHKVSAATGTMGSNDFSPFKAYYFGKNSLLFIKKEIRGVRRLFFLFGLFGIASPFYIFSMVKQKQFAGIKAYTQGIREGLTFFSIATLVFLSH